MICLWVLGFDSFKEWIDDKLKEILYIIVKEWVLNLRIESLPWGENVSLKHSDCLKITKLELPNQSRRKILFLQTTWQSKVIITLVNQFSESCFVRKFC